MKRDPWRTRPFLQGYGPWTGKGEENQSVSVARGWFLGFVNEEYPAVREDLIESCFRTFCDLARTISPYEDEWSGDAITDAGLAHEPLMTHVRAWADLWHIAAPWVHKSAVRVLGREAWLPEKAVRDLHYPGFRLRQPLTLEERTVSLSEEYKPVALHETLDAFEKRLHEEVSRQVQGIRDRLIALDWEETPLKHEPEHFRWLAFRQIEGLTADEIARKSEERHGAINTNDPKFLSQDAVRKAIKRAAEEIGISLRPAS